MICFPIIKSILNGLGDPNSSMVNYFSVPWAPHYSSSILKVQSLFVVEFIDVLGLNKPT